MYTDFIDETHKNISGIYGIFDKITGCCLYVGQTKGLYSRKVQHLKKLRLHTALKSFSTWYLETESDPEMLMFSVLELTDDNDLVKNEREIYWFEYLKPVFYGKTLQLEINGGTQKKLRIKLERELQRTMLN